jgi:ATP-binding cassette subfamily F protein 3
MPHWLPGQVREYLGKYLFSSEDVYKKVNLLSGGERGRLALAKLALQDTNLLLLDEPTNHLDIPSQEVLEAVLDDYEGTILLITHDRYLVDALATVIWEINPDESQMIAFNGTYSQMKEEREKEAARLEGLRSLRELPPRGQTSESGAKPRRRESSDSAKEERRRLAQLQELENRIAALEADLANLGAQLESPFVNANEVIKLGKEYERVQKEMDVKLAEWERLQV